MTAQEFQVLLECKSTSFPPEAHLTPQRCITRNGTLKTILTNHVLGRRSLMGGALGDDGRFGVASFHQPAQLMLDFALM